MSNLVADLLVVGGVVIVLVGLALLAIRVRRSGSAGPAIGAAMAAYDEAMHATGYDTFVEMQTQDERKIPIAAPDDL
jgi:hypothetical protein